MEEHQEVMEQEVPDSDAPVVDETPETGASEQVIDLGAHGRVTLDEIKQWHGERLMQADYTRKMQELAKQREELQKEREALKPAQPAQQPELSDIELPSEVEGDPFGGWAKAMTLQEKMLRSQLADAKRANEELRNQVSSVSELILEDQFERQMKDAEQTYAAGLDLDREEIRRYIAEKGLSAQPRTMVREAVKAIAADKYLERMRSDATAAPDKPKAKPMPRSSSVVPAKVKLSPLDEARQAARELAKKLNWQ